MEKILSIYALSYDQEYPVVCFDERPCFLIGNTVQGLEMKQGQVAKENYAYSKHGSCCVLASIEPLSGQRLVHVRKQRRKLEFAVFMKNLAALYPSAKKIRLVLDNLNTHNASSFYEVFPAKEAAELAERFEFIYTPKSASWLNMIEIEFSALSRQCLNRRIPSINTLASEVFTYMQDRNDKQVKITWQFTLEDAREKLNRHYAKVNFINKK
jgi:transposase